MTTARDLRGEITELLAQLVSVTSVGGEEGPCAQMLAGFFERSGVQADLQELSPGRWNVLGRLDGSAPTVILNGHLDITPAVGEWSTEDPLVLEERDGDYIGLGACNMKAQVAAMAAALVTLAESDETHCGLLFTGVVGECSELGIGTRTFLAEGGQGDFAIVGEPTSLHAQTTHGGTYQAEVRFTGKAAHTSGMEHGVNAAEAASEFVLALRKDDVVPKGTGEFGRLPMALAGKIEAGIFTQLAAPEAKVWCDVRIPPGTPQSAVEAGLDALIARCAETVGAGWSRVRGDYQAPYKMSAMGQPYLDALSSSFQTVAGRAMSVGVPGGMNRYYATDTPYLEGAGIPSVIFGPGTIEIGPDERIPVADTLLYHDVLVDFARRVVR